jgi:hypothetical protein
MIPVAFNDRALIIGKTTSGKSTFARFLFGGMTGARRLLVNVKGLADVGVAPVSSVEAIDWTAPVVNYVPSTAAQEEYEALYQAILAHGGPTTVWLDEAFGPTSGNKAPPSLLVVQQQGAGRGIGHLVCSQRPANIAVPLRTEAEHIFVFVPPISYDDLGALARELAEIDDAPAGPRELRELLREVQAAHGDYSFIWWHRGSGELIVCEPLSPALVGAPLPHPRAPRRQSSAPPPEAVSPGETPGLVPDSQEETTYA